MIRSLKNLWHFIDSWFWVAYYGFPANRLTVIGVTGTDGKTTTTSLIFEILQAAGYKTGMVSTVAAKIGGETVDMGLHVTNPEPKVLQGLLRRMADGGCTHAVIEVTSHGLDQHRVAGCNFKVAVLTNISHEHLDYHGTMERYVGAKARLFGGAKYAVLNKDEKWAETIARRCRGKVVWYARAKLKRVSEALGGEYNRYNIGAAEAVARILGIEKTVPAVVRSFGGVPGRREEVKMGQKFRCVVDFAHTPNALEQLLSSLREELPKKGKLVVVFGCTGERDKEKRPVMGEIACRLADKVIVTSDDVRGEDQGEIYWQIKAGCEGEVLREDDRDKAIAAAVKMARAGDIVAAAGMGHEKTQLIGKTELKRSDRGAFEKAIGDVLT